MLRRQVAERLDERRGKLAHAALALDGLDDHRRDVARARAPREARRRRRTGSSGAADERPERIVQVALRHERDRSERAAVVGALEPQQAGATGRRARELQRGLDAVAAGAREEDVVVVTRALAEPSGEAPGERVHARREPVRRVRVEESPDRVGDDGVSVPEGLRPVKVVEFVARRSSTRRPSFARTMRTGSLARRARCAMSGFTHSW